jgi:ubiquinone/menaquinone biosynthesis C-methylase UbiE
MIINKIISFIRRHVVAKKEMDSQQAYNIWADSYDNQPHNLMLALDELVFSELLNEVLVQGKIIADIGCGTGRHWQKMLDKNPHKIIGFDVSEGMLHILHSKFPNAETHLLSGHTLNNVADNTFDIVISTLSIAHIADAEAALKEWYRVLKPGGDMILTDYHPVALARGGKRTFKNNQEMITIKNHVHSIDRIKTITGQLHLKIIRLIEKPIEDSVKEYYEKNDALAIFEAWKNVPIIYGIHLKKINDTE